MLDERVVLAGDSLLELTLVGDRVYCLRFGKGGRTLVEYRGDGRRHRRRVRGRDAPYEFRSVEQLRYDFERDAEDAERQD